MGLMWAGVCVCLQASLGCREAQQAQGSPVPLFDLANPGKWNHVVLIRLHMSMYTSSVKSESKIILMSRGLHMREMSFHASAP